MAAKSTAKTETKSTKAAAGKAKADSKAKAPAKKGAKSTKAKAGAK